MKYLSKLSFFLLLVAVFFSACDKKDVLPYYVKGNTPELKSSVTAIAATASDSLKTVVVFSWTNPGYSTDSNTVKYTLQIDSAGRNFTKATSFVVTAQLTDSLTGGQINAMLLNYGFSFGVAYSMDVRLVSSYANNNNPQMSNVLTLNMTPYKIPPKVALPASGKLFLVGDATQGGWVNNPPLPDQEFTQLDETTFAGVFKLNGGKQFLVLPTYGSWDTKYALADNSVSGISQGGSFGFGSDVYSQNFIGPATDGYYVITLDFQQGKFTIAPYTGTLPTNLYIIGDATNDGWNNDASLANQKFTRINSSLFELTLPMIGGKGYLLLPVLGSWDNKYAVDDNSVTGLANGGTFGYNLSSNFPGPATDGTYKIDVNFATSKFVVTKQ